MATGGDVSNVVIINENATEISTEVAQDDAQIILEVLDKLRKRKSGQNLENVLKLCEKDFKWSREETRAVIDEVKINKIIEEFIIDGKISFRKFGQDVVFRSKAKPATSKAVDSSFVSDFIDFKKHISNEFSVLKAKVSQGRSPPTDDNERPLGRSDLVQSLHDRIDSLGKQLDCQNQIILKMIDTQQVRVTETANYQKISPSINNAGVAIETKPKSSMDDMSPTHKQLQLPKDKKVNQRSGSTHKQFPKDKKVDKQSGKHEEVANMSKDDSVTVIEDENQKTKVAGNKSRKSVIVIGDSLLNGIDDRGLCKHHNVKVRPHPGTTTRDIADHVKPVARRKPDMVIIHCGTNDLTNDVDTTKHLKEVVQILKEETPHSKIVMSAAIMRRDRQGMKKKIDELKVTVNVCGTKFGFRSLKAELLTECR